MTSSPLAANAASREAEHFSRRFDRVVDEIERAMLGHTDVVRTALTVMLAGGHLLIEDVPGTGKTMLAKSLANAVDVSHSRIQFTPDLLPSDITGTDVFEAETGRFVFHPGPVFASVVVADEINRASPKTQSALLEAMEEGVVTVDGVGHPIGSPFMVVATQNPIERSGTYRLPEAQLDRFMALVELGQPTTSTLITLLEDASTRNRSEAVTAVLSASDFAELVTFADSVFVERSIVEFVANVSTHSHLHPHLDLGISVRGSLALVRAAKVRAASHSRGFVTPDDIKALSGPVLAHRVLLTADAVRSGADGRAVVDELFVAVKAPTRRSS